MAVKVYLKDQEATLKLGRLLAATLSEIPNPPALLLQGDLGSGKTTFVRGFVESLHGSDMAEVSSPSFNIFNLYPTTPPVAHFDLYRLEGMPADDSLFECFDDGDLVTVVEWIQFLDKASWPDEALFLEWTPSETGRSLILRAIGESANGILHALAPELDKI